MKVEVEENAFLEKVVTKVTKLLEAAGCTIDCNKRDVFGHLIKTHAGKTLQIAEANFFGDKHVIFITGPYTDDLGKTRVYEDRFETYDFSWLINGLCEN